MNQDCNVAPGGHSRRSLLSLTLEGGFRLLDFPAEIETDFRRTHAERATRIIALMLPWVTLLYLAAALVMYQGSSESAYQQWLQNALLPVGAAFLWLWVARVTGLLARAPLAHTGVCVAVSLFATARTVFLLGAEPGVIYVTYQVIYLIFIAFTIAQLRLRLGLVIMALTGVALVLANRAERLDANWLAFGQYYVATVLISAVIGYLTEYRERHEWLRNELATLESIEMQELRRQADAEARQQRVLGEYLELVTGNLTPTEIAGRSLRFLIERSGAQIGTIFLVNEHGLRRACSYGLEGETTTPDELGRSESLIGQVADEGRRLRLHHLPPDYHPIRTATGSCSPAELLVEPVRQQNSSLAVIELGSLGHFDDATLALVDRVSRAMAATLVAANARDALARAGMSEFMI